MFNFRKDNFFASEVQKQILQFIHFGLSDAQKGEILRKMVAEESNHRFLDDFIYEHSVGPFMYFEIKEMGLLDDIPATLKKYLQYSYEQNVARNFALKMELGRYLLALNQEGIQAMLLKGAITFVKPIYPTFGLRFLSDIDLLVKRQELAKAVAILEDLGYISDDDNKQSHHHHQGLFPQAGIGLIELHHCPVSLRYADWIDLDSWWAKAEQVTLGRASAYIPSPEHQILHLLLHNGISHYGLLLSSLGRQLDFALNIEFYRTEIDWEALGQRADGQPGKENFLKLLEVYLYLAHKNLGLKLPYRLHTKTAFLQSYLGYIDKISNAPPWSHYVNSCIFNALLKSDNSLELSKNIYDILIHRSLTDASRREIKGHDFVKRLLQHALGGCYCITSMLKNPGIWRLL